jgi:hypothetical protein
MSCRNLGFVLVSLLSFAVCAWGQAGVERIDDLDKPVTGAPGLTYRALVSKIFGGVHDDATSGHPVIDEEKVLRRIGVKDRTELPEGSPLVSFETLRVRGDGKRYLVMLIEAESEEIPIPGGGAAVLAIFSEGSGEPLDVADVKEDVFCGFDDQPKLAIGADDGFVITNSHSNSGQGYLITALMYVHGGRLRIVDSLFTLTVRGYCADSFEEPLTWHTEKDPASPHPKIIATVTLVPSTDDSDQSDCEERKPPLRRQVFTETYRFDRTKDRYVDSGGNLERIDHFNEKNL